MRLTVLFVLAACGNRGETATPSQANAQVGSAAIDASAPIPVITAPHSGAVAMLAVSDDAKAAITSDDNGELRFWPTLDGLHEPVAMRGRAPVGLALARASDGYVAALLDSAGGIELVRLTADGTPHDRRVIPAEPGFEQVAATATTLLARRSDQTIVRLDAPSRPLAPQMGEQILAIAARRNVALVALADPEHPAEIHQVRQIALARDLAWGAAYTLPVPLRAPIGVSPSGRRVAGIDARSGAGTVIDLLGQPRVIASDIVASDAEDGLIGFLDDERAVFHGGTVITIPAMTAVADPWNTTRPTSRLRIGRDPTVTDDVVISGHGTHLMLADPADTLFLGYRDLAASGFLRVTSNAITLGLGNRVLWLDDELRDRRARDIANDATNGTPVDDHRVLKGMFTYLENDRSKLDIALVDAISGLEVQLGTWSQASSITYDPDTHVLAISGYTTTVPRVRLDVEAAKVTPLRPLETQRVPGVELFDPAIANGVIAIATSYDDGVVHETFVDDDKSTTEPLRPAWTTRLANAVTIGFDRTGTIFTLQLKGDQPTHVVVYRRGKEVKRWLVEANVSAGAVDPSGTQIVMFTSTAVVSTDADGRERWRAPMWAVHAMRFTADGKKLIVNTGGGLVTLDAATGARLATACGWGFGLTAEPSLTVFSVPVVCAEAS